MIIIKVLERSEFEVDPKPLGKERFAGCVDSCGGKILANVLTLTKVRNNFTKQIKVLILKFCFDSLYCKTVHLPSIKKLKNIFLYITYEKQFI